MNAPKSIFQNSILYRAANSVDSPPSCGEGLGVNFGASKKSSAGFPASGRDHTLEAVVRKLGVNRQQSLAREELGNTEEESRNSLTRPRSTDSFNLRAAARMRSILNQRA